MGLNVCAFVLPWGSGNVQEAAAVRELGKWEDATSKCGYCKDGPSFKRHLMLSLGTLIIYDVVIIIIIGNANENK